MSVFDSQIPLFEKWLFRRGRLPSTVSEYGRTIRRLLDLEDPISALLDRASAPGTRNHQATVLRQWAKFSQNAELSAQLSEIRLPHPGRRQVRIPHEKKEWFEIIRQIQKSQSFRPTERSVMLIIAIRGIRCGDVLRLQQKDILEALKTGRLGFISKGEKPIVFGSKSISEPLKQLAKMRWPEDGHVWNLVCPRSSAQKAYDSASRRIRLCMKKLEHELGYEKGDLYSHRMRHTFVNQFLAEMQGDSAAVFKLQDMMQWSSLNTARSYVKRAELSELDEIEKRMFSSRRK